MLLPLFSHRRLHTRFLERVLVPSWQGMVEQQRREHASAEVCRPGSWLRVVAPEVVLREGLGCSTRTGGSVKNSRMRGSGNRLHVL